MLPICAKQLASVQQCSGSKRCLLMYFIYTGIALKLHLLKSKHNAFDDKRKMNVGFFPSCQGETAELS